MNEEARRDIGGSLGEVLDVDAKSIVSEHARFLRISVDLPLDKPLQRGALVISPEGDKLWLAFKYERIVGLCYSCGWLGHKMKTCPHHSSSSSDTEAVNLPYGDWLKAGGRRRVDEPRVNESSHTAGHECGGCGTSSRSSPNHGNPNRLTRTTSTRMGYAADIVDEIG